MPFLELFDETLDINSTENYELSIQASTDALSFCLLDSIRNKFVLLRSFVAEENKYFNAEKISELIRNDDFLIKHYRKVNCVLPSRKFTMIPRHCTIPVKKMIISHSIITRTTTMSCSPTRLPIPTHICCTPFQKLSVMLLIVFIPE
jgi:hypothetical protein